jgi:hypothetical protein
LDPRQRALAAIDALKEKRFPLSFGSAKMPAASRPSRTVQYVLLAVIFLGPLWLFRESLLTYRLHSDDFAYLGASRTLPRALSNLFVPHNTHIVPAWRILTWAVVATAGRLAGLPYVLAVVSYVALAITMLLLGRFVTRETGQPAVGLAAMVGFGTTSILKHAATWYSAGQSLWAGIGLLLMLNCLQGWRSSGGGWRLVGAAFSAWLAGGFWTVGHAAGPIGAVYVWSAPSPRTRKAAAVPLLATLIAVAVAFILGGKHIDARISFHGRTQKEAADSLMGMSHTLQAIPENLVLGNLGLTGETTVLQGAALSVAIGIVWIWSRRDRLRGEIPRRINTVVAMIYAVGVAGLLCASLLRAKHLTWIDILVGVAFAWLGQIVVSSRARPLERTGAALVLLAYLIEWSFRGYLPFSSLRGVVPWYDAIPQIGAVLFAAGWWSGDPPKSLTPAPTALSWPQAGGVLLFEIALLVAHQPRMDNLFIESVPQLSDDENARMSDETKAMFESRFMQKARADFLAREIAGWQRRHLARLDRAEAVARRAGIGREGIARTFGRLDMPELPKVYDAAPLLDLPWRGPENDAAIIRRTLGSLLAMEPEPVFPMEVIGGGRR